jgi:hypothetical protein
VLAVGVAAVLAAVLAVPVAANAEDQPWTNTALPAAERADLLVGAMTLDEKIQQIAMRPVANTNIPGCGFSSGGRHVEGIARLSIPTLRMTNGPFGYLLPFEMTIQEANLASVMCSYPRLTGTFACENDELLDDWLRDDLGFEGYVMSDRGATHSTAPAIKAGLDLEFASPRGFTPALINDALAAGTLEIADIDLTSQGRGRPRLPGAARGVERPAPEAPRRIRQGHSRAGSEGAGHRHDRPLGVQPPALALGRGSRCLGHGVG